MSLEMLADAIIDVIKRELEVAGPGIVESFDASTQTVSVRPAIRCVDEAEEEQEDYFYRDPAIKHRVPVLWPIARGFRLKGLTLQKGDPVLLVATDTAFGNWWNSNGMSDPDDHNRHMYGAGCVALAGLLPRTNPIPEPNDAAALASKVNARFEAIESWISSFKTVFDAHTHSGVTTGSGFSGGPTFPANGAPSGTDVDSAILKISS